MEEGEQKLCLVEPTLELTEETPLQVQMQLLEKMEDGEASEAEEEREVWVDIVLFLLIIQPLLEVVAELVAMEVAAEAEIMEG